MRNIFNRTPVQKILWIGNDLTSDIHKTISEEMNLQHCDLSAYRRAVEAMKPHLIIIGNEIPHLQVLHIIEGIRLDSASAHTLVMLLADSTFHELEYLQTGVDHFIVMPIRTDILCARIRTILESQRRLQLHFRRQAGLPDDPIQAGDHDQLLLDKATRIVETNLDNTAFNVQSLVYEMHMSQSVLYRRIKEMTGYSVIEFIKSIRLTKAAQLLHQPQARVSEVAFMVGIEDPKNFRTSFQRKYYITPSQYAKMHRLQG